MRCKPEGTASSIQGSSSVDGRGRATAPRALMLYIKEVGYEQCGTHFRWVPGRLALRYGFVRIYCGLYRLVTLLSSGSSPLSA